MTSIMPIRDPSKDALLTPENCALLIIDFQPIQVASIASMEKRTLVSNVVAVAKAAKLYGLPIVVASVNVETGINQPTIHQLTDVLGDTRIIDRTAINAWEDSDFVQAVMATGRRKLVVAALWALRILHNRKVVIASAGGTIETSDTGDIDDIGDRSTTANAQNPHSAQRPACSTQSSHGVFTRVLRRPMTSTKRPVPCRRRSPALPAATSKIWCRTPLQP